MFDDFVHMTRLVNVTRFRRVHARAVVVHTDHGDLEPLIAGESPQGVATAAPVFRKSRLVD
jgi:hypothetical protein